MNELIREYNDIVLKRQKLLENKKELEEDPNVQKYIMSLRVNKRLLQEEKSVYEEMKLKEYKKCKHILVYTKVDTDKRGRTYKKCSCIKCGLTENILDEDYSKLSFEDRVMYDYLKQNKSYIKGINIGIECNYSLGLAIFSRIKTKYPYIKDNKSIKYFKHAIYHIKFDKVSENRLISRAKRLSLDNGFDNWKSINDIRNKND